jgi:hypothetical protein
LTSQTISRPKKDPTERRFRLQKLSFFPVSLRLCINGLPERAEDFSPYGLGLPVMKPPKRAERDVETARDTSHGVLMIAWPARFAMHEAARPPGRLLHIDPSLAHLRTPQKLFAHSSRPSSLLSS